MDNSIKNTQNVFVMSDYQPHSGYAPLSLIEAYWDALRAGREMPKRAEIDPRGIETALPYAFILERVSPGVARMRIAGSHLHDLMGMEARGMPLTSFFEVGARVRIAGPLEEVFQTPGTAEVSMQSASSAGQPPLDARMILLPLKSDLGDVSRFLGCLVSLGNLGVVPRRFDLRDITLHPLESAPKAKKLNPSKTAQQGFAEAKKPFMGPGQNTGITNTTAAKTGADKTATEETGIGITGTGKKRPPYLRLIVSDD